MAQPRKTSADNYIYSYYQQIQNGKIIVGRWVRDAYSYIIKGLEERSFYFDKQKADHAIDWIENHCFHLEGRKATTPMLLELWQKAFLSVMFGIVDDNGLRHFREFFMTMGRKCGKTILGACIARYIWENEGFGTRIYNVAPKLDQADLIYDSIWVMTTLDPDWIEKKKKSEERDAHKRKINEDDPTMARHRMSDLVIPGTNATVKKIAFSAKKSDGFNPSLVICDEVGAWQGDQGLKQYEVMKSGMGAREEPILLSITTANYISDSIYDELYTRSTRFLKGESNEKRLFPLIYQIDDNSKWNDINELQKSMPNLGVSVSIDYMLEEIAVAEGSLSKQAEFKTKYCCLKQNSSVAWLDTDTVEKTVGDPLDLNDFKNCYAVMGIDLSRTTDLTSAVLLIEKDEKIHTFARFYLPADKIDEAIARDNVPYRAFITRGLLFPSGDNFIDYKDVFDWCRELIEKYRIYVLMVGYDRYSSQYLVSDLKDYGFHTDDVFQGENLTPVIRETEGLMKDGKIDIGNNDLLKLHFFNSALKINTETERCKLIKVEQRAHIDGMAAFLCAMTVRQKYWNEIGRQLTNERR